MFLQLSQTDDEGSIDFSNSMRDMLLIAFLCMTQVSPIFVIFPFFCEYDKVSEVVER